MHMMGLVIASVAFCTFVILVCLHVVHKDVRAILEKMEKDVLCSRDNQG